MKDDWSLVQSSLRALIYSSVTFQRSSKGGACKLSNSSFIHPTPNPTMTLPLESIVQTGEHLGSNDRVAIGAIMTLVAKRIAWSRREKAHRPQRFEMITGAGIFPSTVYWVRHGISLGLRCDRER